MSPRERHTFGVDLPFPLYPFENGPIFCSPFPPLDWTKLLQKEKVFLCFLHAVCYFFVVHPFIYVHLSAIPFEVFSSSCSDVPRRLENVKLRIPVSAKNRTYFEKISHSHMVPMNYTACLFCFFLFSKEKGASHIYKYLSKRRYICIRNET